ncbi:MAG: ASPIC/UnbV domain-containing protein, partial [bacterium]
SWCDIDNDGDLDLFVANATVRGIGTPDPALSFLYANNGDGTFTKIVAGSVVSNRGYSTGDGFGDYDNDGDLDLFVADIIADNILYSNNGNSNNWINIKCIGTISNTSGIGAKVRAKATINGTSVWQLHEISAQTGFAGQNSLNAEFGLGDATVIDSIKIEWPSGTVQVLTDVSVNQFLIVTESTGSITVRPPSKPILGKKVDITITPPSNFQPSNSQLFYRKAGQTKYQMTSLTQVGNELQGTIPSDFVTMRGIEYYVALSDGNILVTYPETDPVNNPAILQVQIDQLDYQLTLQEQTYKMISLPLALNNTEIDSVLSDDYGEYEVLPRQWRLFRWKNGAYAEHPDMNAEFTPATAFWLITRDGKLFDLDNGQSVISGQPFTINLQPGWNQIANPFAFPVAWDSTSATGRLDTLAYFDGTEYQFNITVLQPWEGYFVYNLETVPVTLTIPSIESQAAPQPIASKSNLDNKDKYLLQLAAVIQGTKLKDTQNFLGFMDHVSEGRDALDFLEPPPIGKYVRLSIIEGNKKYAGNFKPLNERGQEWQLEIASSLPNQQVQISFLETGQLPEGFHRYFLDKDFHSLIPVNDNLFTIQLDKQFPFRRLLIIIGTKEYAEQNTDGIPLIPLDFSLEQNYPNPFNPETTIRYQISNPGWVVLEIYNVLGQKVRTLVKEEQDAGSFSVKWNGLDDKGFMASSGVYVYRLKAGKFSATRKLVLIR